jgi:hypothetical protein
VLREIYYAHKAPLSRTSASQTPEPEHGHSLAISKSIKAMVSRSSDHVDASIVLLPNADSLQGGDLHDAGTLIADATPTLSVRRSEGTLYGLAWTRRELTVSSPDLFEEIELTLQAGVLVRREPVEDHGSKSGAWH